MWSRNRSVDTEATLGAFSAGGEGQFVRESASADARQAGSLAEESELKLVHTVLAGDARAARRLLDRISPTLWSAVIKLEGGGPDGEAAFLHVVAALKADAYARLRSFDGRSRLSTYLALVAREILAERLARGFSEQPGNAWKRFARFFEGDIRRRVAHRMSRNTSEAAREDLYQDICLALVEDNYHRIRSYSGRGSFAGYILTIVDRILIDLIRRDSPRKRLPVAIVRLSALDQAIYAAVAWEGCPHDITRLTAVLRGRLEQDPQPDEIAEALARVVAIGRLERAPPRSPYDMVSLDALVEDGGDLPLADSGPTPEDHLLLAEEEASRGAVIGAIKEAAAALPSDQRLYLQIVFSASEPLAARDIAKLMGYPVEEVYRLKQRTQRWLKELATRLNIKSGPSV